MKQGIKSAAKRAKTVLTLPNPEQTVSKANLSVTSLKEKMIGINSHFPEDAVTLSVIQDALDEITGTDILSLSIKLGSKTDIRATIKFIQETNVANSSLLMRLIPDYPLQLILAYGA